MKLSYLIFTICIFISAPASFAQVKSSKSTNTDTGQIVNHWSFNKKITGKVPDDIQQRKDSLYGNYEYVPGINGKALKLDGFRTYIRRNPYGENKLNKAFTLESWIALASYPWSWAPILDCSYPSSKGFFFGVDQSGRIGFNIAAGDSWFQLSTKQKIELRKWNHVAAVFESDHKITIFINGQEEASIPVDGSYIPSRSGTLTIGRNNMPQNWNEFQLKTKNTFFFLDGILDEIKITAKAKSKYEISQSCNAEKDLPVPALSKREHLPTGQAGDGNFGAFYTKLNYYKEWDDLWRVSDDPDLFVRFDESPVQLVFWRGTSFVPCWVSENNIWYLNEWLETWGQDVKSCAEPIMDRHCRYSHVRLIENTAARAVIHWRYALNDAFYDFAAISDDGRGEWCDEYHIIYPDQVGIRRMDLHYSRPERKHDWVEQIVVLPPGKYPDDVIEEDAVTLVNMDGDVHNYSWHDENLKIEMPEPRKANMSYVNLKSDYRPFFIISPNPVETVEGKWDSPFFRTYAAKMARGYRQDPVPSVYGWWNHWPVAQVPGDGRWVSTPDRPSHFNLTTFVQWEDYEYTPSTRTRIMLQGMTNKKPDELVPLAKSWLQAPAIKMAPGAFIGGNYDQSERAYMLERTDSGKACPCEITLEASKEAPLQNPAFIIKNWGSRLATLTIDGKTVDQGKDFRQGIRNGIEGEDLILWLRLEREKPVKILLK